MTGTKRRGLLGFAASAAAFAVIWVGVTFSYGGYDDHYDLVGDFPLCNKSFNCSYSGHDL